MTMFLVYAALLAGVALAFVLTPLLRGYAKSGAAPSRAASNLNLFRDQLAELDADLAAGTVGREQWESARADLQRELLDTAGASDSRAVAPAKRSKAAAIAIGIALPLVSVSMYLGLGSPQGLDPNKPSATQGASHQLSPEQIETMVARLAQRLQANPDDGEGWIMLARTYAALGRFVEAAGAYARAESKFPQDAQFLADYADALAMAQGQNLLGGPEALVRRALQADGNNLKALALAGTVEFEKREFGKAVEYWQRILPLLPPDSNMGDSVRASIKEARDKQGGVPKSSSVVAPGADTAKSPVAGAKGASISGTVRLAPALAARAAPEDSVFVLARPAQGPRAPLAVVRAKVKDLPLAFSFDDTMAMNSSAKLSDFAEVVVAARVSKSGNVIPQGGDLEGVSKPLRAGSAGNVVEITRLIP